MWCGHSVELWTVDERQYSALTVAVSAGHQLLQPVQHCSSPVDSERMQLLLTTVAKATGKNTNGQQLSLALTIKCNAGICGFEVDFDDWRSQLRFGSSELGELLRCMCVKPDQLSLVICQCSALVCSPTSSGRDTWLGEPTRPILSHNSRDQRYSKPNIGFRVSLAGTLTYTCVSSSA